MVRLLPHHIRRVMPGQRRHAHEPPVERGRDSEAAREGELRLQGEVLQPLVLRLVLRLVLVLLVLQGPVVPKASPVVHMLAGDGLRSSPTLHRSWHSARWRWAAAGVGKQAVVQGHKDERLCKPQ